MRTRSSVITQMDWLILVIAYSIFAYIIFNDGSEESGVVSSMNSPSPAASAASNPRKHSGVVNYSNSK